MSDTYTRDPVEGQDSAFYDAEQVFLYYGDYPDYFCQYDPRSIVLLKTALYVLENLDCGMKMSQKVILLNCKYVKYICVAREDETTQEDWEFWVDGLHRLIQNPTQRIHLQLPH